MSVDVDGLTIADDPAFSSKPFLAASDVKVDVEFLPLLAGEARVSRLELSKPDIRLVMNANGDLNVASIGANPGEAPEVKGEERSRRKKKSSLADLSIKALSIEDGEFYFNDLGEKAVPIRVHHLDFDVTNFNAASAFDVETKFAFPGDTQNVEASGKLGPLLNRGVLDASGIPIDLTLQLDSIVLDNLRPLADIGPHIPPGLSIPDAASVNGTAHGTVATLAIALSTDLTANRVAYTTIFNKPAGTAMTVNVNGSWGDQLQIASVSLKLSDLELTASRISGVTGPQPLSAQIDSNSFNLANLGPMINAVAEHDLAGMSEVHGTVTLNPNAPTVDGTVTLKQAALKLGPSVQGGISDLNGSISFTNGVGVVAPTSFALGSAHASLEGRVDSLSPLRASYALKADSVRLAQILASRPNSDVVNGLDVNGTANGEISSPRLSATIRSTDGSLQNVAYNNLDLTAAYFNHRVSARPLNVGLFGGSITADADAEFGEVPTFDTTLVMRNLNIEEGLRSQNIEAAHTLRGFLTGNVAANGQRRELGTNQADAARQRARLNRERQAGGRQYCRRRA